MRFSIVTLGCKVNQYESGTIESRLRESGHEQVSPGDGCDVCIINTCAVTGESSRKSRQAIRRMKTLEPSAKIAVCGCYSELEPEAVSKIGVDIIAGTQGKQGDGSSAFVTSVSSISPAQPTQCQKRKNRSPASRTRALLKIQDGCDNFCTYCIVPYIRGHSRSVPLTRIKEYAKQQGEQGYKEIVITGIELSSYGKTKTGGRFLCLTDGGKTREKTEEPSPCLAAAIQAIHTAAPNARLRLGSLDPSILTDEFCRELSKIPNLCNHFHLSLQSGCDDTLKRMGRKYTVRQVLKSIASIRTHFMDCAVTADLITGFPGETEDEFDLTLKLIEKAAFSDMHIFQYSQRPGTKASQMPRQVDKSIKKKRADMAKKAANIMAEDFRNRQIGKTMEVLFEQEKNGYSKGHSSNYLEVAVKQIIDKNSIKKVKITGVKNSVLTGEIV